LRVRLTEDAGGVPGATLEVLSENEAIWPAYSNPFTTTTTLTSQSQPLLLDGASYWLVTEPTAIPAADPGLVDYRWYANTGGTTVPVLQQTSAGLPADPWNSATVPIAAAIRVEGPPCFVDAAVALTGAIDSSADWGDYDNDGDLDLAIVGTVGPPFVALYRSSGGGFPTFTSIVTGIPGSERGDVAWGDCDNDGDLDLLVTSNAGSAVYMNDGGTNPTFSGGANLDQYWESSAAWGDFDNDDDLDIVISGWHLVHGYVTVVYRNDGASPPSFIPFQGLNPVGDSSVAWGDFDNDGDLDVVVAGDQTTKVHVYNGFTFDEHAVTLPRAAFASVAWADCDNDGDLDFLLAGYEGDQAEWFTRVYRNDGGPLHQFTDVGAGLPGMAFPSVAWVDYDNDGHLDISLTGTDPTRIFRNSGSPSPTFDDLGGMIEAHARGSIDWADYDSDGDLDVLLTGYSPGLPGARAMIYRNVCGTGGVFQARAESGLEITSGPNTAPSPPVNLVGRIDGLVARLSWDPATDAETPSAGLSYNLRVGTSPGAGDVVSPMANALTGFRRVPGVLGNVHLNTRWDVHLPGPGTYYWSVQAVDGASSGSTFAIEQIPVDTQSDPVPTAHELRTTGSHPGRGAFSILFSLPEAGPVSLSVYDPAGRRVRNLVHEALPAGRFTRVWDGKDESGQSVSSGMYFVQMQCSAVTKTTKALLLR
jgi:hypothetical protein